MKLEDIAVGSRPLLWAPNPWVKTHKITQKGLSINIATPALSLLSPKLLEKTESKGGLGSVASKVRKCRFGKINEGSEF